MFYNIATAAGKPACWAGLDMVAWTWSGFVPGFSPSRSFCWIVRLLFQWLSISISLLFACRFILYISDPVFNILSLARWDREFQCVPSETFRTWGAVFVDDAPCLEYHESRKHFFQILRKILFCSFHSGLMGSIFEKQQCFGHPQRMCHKHFKILPETAMTDFQVRFETFVDRCRKHFI